MTTIQIADDLQKAMEEGKLGTHDLIAATIAVGYRINSNRASAALRLLEKRGMVFKKCKSVVGNWIWGVKTQLRLVK